MAIIREITTPEQIATLTDPVKRAVVPRPRPPPQRENCVEKKELRQDEVILLMQDFTSIHKIAEALGVGDTTIGTDMKSKKVTAFKESIFCWFLYKIATCKNEKDQLEYLWKLLTRYDIPSLGFGGGNNNNSFNVTTQQQHQLLAFSTEIANGNDGAAAGESLSDKLERYRRIVHRIVTEQTVSSMGNFSAECTV